MVDNHLNLRVQPEGEAWLSSIISMATVLQLHHLIGRYFDIIAIATNQLFKWFAKEIAYVDSKLSVRPVLQRASLSSQ